MKNWVFSWIGIAVIIVSYMWYNHIFVREEVGNKVIETINSTPYAVHFTANQQQPTSFFTAAAFPAYTKWCHENQKLCEIMPLQQLYADIQRLGSIQFIWSQWVTEEIAWLSKMIDSLTTIAPYRSYPYAFGQLLIPLPKQMGSWKGNTWDMQNSFAQQTRIDAARISQKWEYYTCDAKKIASIRALSEEDFIALVYDTGTRLPYLNPCPTYERAHYAAFNAFYYMNDAEEAAQNFKISAFHDNAPWLTPLMAALVYGRGGEHLKSATLWYDRYINIMTKQTVVDDILIEDANRAIKKAVLELQLQLITEAATDTPICNKSYSCLQKNNSLVKSIQHSYNDICKVGKEQNNIRCILLDVWLQSKWITLDGRLVYPVNEDYVFAWNMEYNSRWIQPK